jgi:hypothetical protein
MRAREPFELMLPPQSVANPAFAFERQLAAARRFLASRGIHEVRAVYGRAGSGRATLATMSCFPVACAANDPPDHRAADDAAA